MIIMGSQAMLYWFGEAPRVPSDTDYIVHDKSRWNQSQTQEYFENPIILMDEQYSKDGYITPDALYTLKISHAIGWPIKTEKHLYDIDWLKQRGCKFDKELFDKLYAYWIEVHGPNKRSDLEMSAEDFFTNALPNSHQHDYLHTLLNPIPTYTKVLKDGAEVEVSEEKFNNLSYEEKCALVREEVYLMAWERFRKMDYRRAYSRMLTKFLLNHAPVFEAIFIAQNHRELHKPLFNYYEVLDKGLNLE